MHQSGQAAFEYLVIVLGCVMIAYGWFNAEQGALADMVGQIRDFYGRYTQFIALVMV